MQVTIPAIILYGVYIMMVRRRRRAHGLIMATLVVLNAITLAEVMAQTYYGLRPSPVNLPAFIILVHRCMGLAAVVLTTVVAFTWIFRVKNNGCPGTKRKGRFITRTTFAVWAAAQLQGIAVLAAYI